MRPGAAGRERRPLSIALRMSLWYALSGFALVAIATGFLYWVLASNLQREDARFEADELSNIRLLLTSLPVSRAPSLPAAVDQDRELYVRLIDRTGAVRLETPGMAEVVPPPSLADLAAVHTPRGVLRNVATDRGGPFQTVTATLAEDGAPNGGFVQIAMNLGDDERLLAIYRQRMILTLVVALLATAAAGYLIARAGMRPIERIGETAARIGSSTLHERIAGAGLPAELYALARAFNTMLDRLEQSFTRVSRFSDDVAHELRTPINNLRGEIEVALNRDRPPEAYRQVLGSALEECGRIARIIQSLLFLARGDDARGALRREEIDVGRELSAVHAFYEAAAEDRGVTLTVAAEPQLQARLDRTLFQQAVGNLLSNAIAHTPEGGDVRLEGRRQDDTLHVVVSDTGCGVAAEHLPHVFERFYRVDASRTGSEHVGLGLAVVRSIVERHGGRADMQSAPGQGARVELVFPDGQMTAP